MPKKFFNPKNKLPNTDEGFRDYAKTQEKRLAKKYGASAIAKIPYKKAKVRRKV